MAGPNEMVVGKVRVQALSKTLVRIEERGPRGFEDRETFTVVHRPELDVRPTVEQTGATTVVDFNYYRVEIPNFGRNLDGTKVLTPRGRVLYAYEGKTPAPSFLPPPGKAVDAYVVADSPRLVPPSWGATPAPKDNRSHKATSGWDVGNDAPDLYVFVPGKAGYEQVRRDFLDLTGPSPMLPRWAFGFWDSRWYPYDEELALKTIDEYRKRGFPLDGFVVDTDWRLNGSHGYTIDTKYFPDMGRFIRRAHEKNVHLMFNDHPEPVDDALSPKELEYRWQGLTSLLNLGMDVWWYDRNWHTHLREPMPGIPAEVWGQRMFHDITQRTRPNQRPMAMSNFQGIDNGVRNYAPHPAGHRFPMMWTGDTPASFESLQKGIANGVDMGLLALHPYVNEDLGGHFATPTPELYVRFIQYGALCPLMRIHCTRDQDRHPWAFGEDAERLTKEYVKLRYRLLPTIYAASRKSYEDGTPMLRRLDLEWPQFAEAKSNAQFMLGDDLLVAPVTESRIPPGTTIPSEFLKTRKGEPGLLGSYFLGRNLEGKAQFQRVDPQISFEWTKSVPRPGWPKEDYSVRWEGVIGPVPETGKYVVSTKTDDGARLYLDGEKVIDEWKGQPSTEYSAEVEWTKGSRHRVVMEYFQWGGGADAALNWVLPSQKKDLAEGKVWLPPGEWTDLWSGNRIEGGKALSMPVELWKLPLYAREGALIVTAPEVKYADEKPWNMIALEAFVPSKDGRTVRTLYEDDGISTGYLKGEHRKTTIEMERRGASVKVRIHATSGNYNGAIRERGWSVRLHLPKGMSVKGGEATASQKRTAESPMPLLGAGALALPGEKLVEFRLKEQRVDRDRELSIELVHG